jgi:hypothetical protein
MQTDTEWWRAQIVRLVTGATVITMAQYDRERWVA